MTPLFQLIQTQQRIQLRSPLRKSRPTLGGLARRERSQLPKLWHRQNRRGESSLRLVIRAPENSQESSLPRGKGLLLPIPFSSLLLFSIILIATQSLQHAGEDLRQSPSFNSGHG